MPATKTALDVRHAQEIVKNVFTLLRSYGTLSATPNASELQKLFAQDFQLIHNDRKVCNNLNEYAKRLQDLQKLNSQTTYSNLMEEAIVAGNKIVIRYGAEVNRKSGQKAQFQIIGILTIADDKIIQATEVIHEKGSGSFDS